MCLDDRSPVVNSFNLHNDPLEWVPLLSLPFYRWLPHGPVVKNLPCSAGYMGLIPGKGTKILHTMGQPSPCAATTEPMCQN